MSNALAIATVTAMLREKIHERMIIANVSDIVGSEVAVSAVSPDLIKTETNGKNQINLFLYQVNPNSGWQNLHLPSRDNQGERVSNPPLALNLHYLLTAYAKEDMYAEALIGYAMQFIHEMSALTREAIRKIQKKWSGETDNFLKAMATSQLADQTELIKFSPQSMTNEEISKLWSAFQTKYRPSVVYLASVVLIESDYSTKSSLPVRERRLHVMPFRQPVIEKVSPQLVKSGDTFTIYGYNLKSVLVKVIIGGVILVTDPDKALDNQIEISVPAGLRAGINTVQVVHELDFGTSKEPHKGFESNLGVFILRPVIIPTAQNIVSRIVDGITVKKGEIKVDFVPRAGKKQKVILLLNQTDLPPNTKAGAYSFNAPLDNGITDPNILETATIIIPFDGVLAGTYLVRVQVDGAENEPGTDSITGEYNAPKVTL